MMTKWIIFLQNQQIMLSMKGEKLKVRIIHHIINLLCFNIFLNAVTKQFLKKLVQLLGNGQDVLIIWIMELNLPKPFWIPVKGLVIYRHEQICIIIVSVVWYVPFFLMWTVQPQTLKSLQMLEWNSHYLIHSKTDNRHDMNFLNSSDFSS